MVLSDSITKVAHSYTNNDRIWIVEPCATLRSIMKRPRPVLIDFQGINDPSYPQPIKPDSEFWFEWLEHHRSFRFLGEYGLNIYSSPQFTANKDSRGYWTASRKIDGKLRRKRLGNSQQIKYDRLLETANILKQNYKDFDLKHEYQALRRKYEIQREQVQWLKFYKKRCSELEAEIEHLKKNKP